jgi:hypothetical protein
MEPMESINDKEKPLRRDIGFSGNILGETLVEQDVINQWREK